ncbi:MAG: methyltransferase domain-containing protein [Methyloligellaceae bacterium]
MNHRPEKPQHLAEIDAFYRNKIAAAGSLAADRCAKAPPLAPDYDADALSHLPPGVTQTSFGCGNPLAFAGVRPGETVLDLGCGAGLDLLVAAERTGPNGRVIGVDMSEAMAEQARVNARRAGLANIEVHNGVIEQLPVDSASVHWVVSNCVINLAADKPTVFREIHRVLRPGGQMLISDLVANDLPDWVHASKDLYAACVSHAVSEAQYLAAAEAAGLSDVAVVDRMTYGQAELRVLVRDELPVALEALADRLGKSADETLEFVVRELTDRIQSVKVYAKRQVASGLPPLSCCA